MAQRDSKEVALSFYNNTFEANHKLYLSTLASSEFDEVRKQYLQLFEWTPSVLDSLRLLTDRLFFRGESQHIDIILQDFAESWYEKFQNDEAINLRNSNGVYLISYSLILLNTDLHNSEGTRKHITKSDYIKNTLNALKLNNVFYTNENKIEIELNRYYDELLKNDLKLFNSPYSSLVRKSLENDNLSIYSSGSSSPSLNQNRSFGFASLLLNDRSLKKQSSKDSLSSSGNTSLLSSPYTMKSTFSSSQLSTLSNLNEMDDEFDEMFSQNLVLEEDGDLELELDGPPWIKEGLINVILLDNEPEKPKQQRSSIFGGLKKSKNLNYFSKWRNGFVVVSKGELRIFSFDVNPNEQQQQQQYQQKSKSKLGSNNNITRENLFGHKGTSNEPVGAGNWYDSAQCIGEYSLCQTYASRPTPLTHASLKLLKSIPTKNMGHHYWSLTLPLPHANSKKHPKLVFQCGSDEISREFIDSCNFWSARSSNVPNEHSTVSSFEYGWSKNLIKLIDTVESNKYDSELVHELRTTKITEWTPLLGSTIPSSLTMSQQLKQLQLYIKSLNLKLEQFQNLKPKLEQLSRFMNSNRIFVQQPVAQNSSFSFRKRQDWSSSNSAETYINVRLILSNYNKKLNYLNRELLKYKKYLSSLTSAIKLRNEKLNMSDTTITPKKENNEIYGDEEFGANEKIIMVGE